MSQVAAMGIRAPSFANAGSFFALSSQVAASSFTSIVLSLYVPPGTRTLAPTTRFVPSGLSIGEAAFQATVSETLLAGRFVALRRTRKVRSRTRESGFLLRTASAAG